MKIDLRKLYAHNHLEVNEEAIIPEDYYSNMGVIRMDPVNVSGHIDVNYDNNLEININANGCFIMPCAITNEELSVPFECQIEDEILENSLNNNFFLDLLDILWENIVLEIPIRVVKEGAVIEHLQGEGWEVIGN